MATKIQLQSQLDKKVSKGKVFVFRGLWKLFFPMFGKCGFPLRGQRAPVCSATILRRSSLKILKLTAYDIEINSVLTKSRITNAERSALILLKLIH